MSANNRFLFSSLPLQLQYIDDILRWRSVTMSDHVLYSVINAKVRLDCFEISSITSGMIF